MADMYLILALALCCSIEAIVIIALDRMLDVKKAEIAALKRKLKGGDGNDARNGN